MSCLMTENTERMILAEYIAAILNDAGRPGVVEGIKKVASHVQLNENEKAAFKKCIKYGFYCAEDVYRLLTKMNKKAYKSRYGEVPADDEGYRGDPLIDTNEASRPDWQVRLYNLLRFFNYQCAEDGVIESIQYRAMKQFETGLAKAIAGDAVHDAGLRWGQW